MMETKSPAKLSLPLNCWFDIETNYPDRSKHEPTAMFEFACVLEDPLSLTVKSEYRTYIHTQVMEDRKRTYGFLGGKYAESLKGPAFKEVADTIYAKMHGRVWLGHNIKRFDIPHLKKAFEAVGKTPPTPLYIVDTLTFLESKKLFWRSMLKNLKLCTLAEFYQLPKQKHEALADVHLNREAFQKACTTLFLSGGVARERVETHVTVPPKPKNTAVVSIETAACSVDECDELMKKLAVTEKCPTCE